MEISTKKKVKKQDPPRKISFYLNNLFKGSISVVFMQIFLNEKEKEKNIEFTKKIYEMKNLDGYRCSFRRDTMGSVPSDGNCTSSIENIIKSMENAIYVYAQIDFFEGQRRSSRYIIKPFSIEDRRTMEMYFESSEKNLKKIGNLYKKVFGRDFKKDDREREVGEWWI